MLRLPKILLVSILQIALADTNPLTCMYRFEDKMGSDVLACLPFLSTITLMKVPGTSLVVNGFSVQLMIGLLSSMVLVSFFLRENLGVGRQLLSAVLCSFLKGRQPHLLTCSISRATSWAHFTFVQAVIGAGL